MERGDSEIAGTEMQFRGRRPRRLGDSGLEMQLGPRPAGATASKGAVEVPRLRFDGWEIDHSSRGHRCGVMRHWDPEDVPENLADLAFKESTKAISEQADVLDVRSSWRLMTGREASRL